ncbi:hypothetical protein MKW92_038208 [Papaver armeniacum]|nr:hypothetical protein MKW92_038208 [Papaver armeniacum]
MVDTQFGVIGGGGTDFGFNSVSSFNGGNRSKTLRPLEIFPPVGAQPTLFQKRAALRQNSDKGGGGLMNLEMKFSNEEEDFDEASIDGSGLNYDTDEAMKGNNNKIGDSVKNGGGITRMASILGDAIEYLKELLQRINDLHNELESTPPGTALPPSSSFHPLTPTPPTRRHVEVRVREGRAVNIHMFCSRRPGLLLSTMRALDGLGIDIKQSCHFVSMGLHWTFFGEVISRFQSILKGWMFRPRKSKQVLLNSRGFHGMI